MRSGEGGGLFETIRVEEGRPRRLDLHLDRLHDGLERLGLRAPGSREETASAVEAAAAAAPRPLARLRLVVTRRDDGATRRSVSTRPYRPPAPEDYRRGVAAIVDTERRLAAGRPGAGLKSLSRDRLRASLEEAERRGAWEALLLDDRGRVVEGSRSNLVVVRDGMALTPPVADGALPGTIRRLLMEAGELRERRLTLADLEGADEVLLTNALVEVLPVGRIDGRAVPVGPAGGELRRRVQERGEEKQEERREEKPGEMEEERPEDSVGAGELG